jgi:hypothetical protein
LGLLADAIAGAQGRHRSWIGDEAEGVGMECSLRQEIVVDIELGELVLEANHEFARLLGGDGRLGFRRLGRLLGDLLAGDSAGCGE